MEAHCVKVTTSVSIETGLIRVSALNGGLDAVAEVVNLVSFLSEYFDWWISNRL